MYNALLHVCTVHFNGLSLILLIFCFMQVKALDPNAYFSCDDHFPIVGKAFRCDEGVGHFQDHSLNNDSTVNVYHEAVTPHGIC